MARHLAAALLLMVVVVPTHAHDTWVQTNTNVVRAGDVVFVDLMLGNHGNEHRDFKQAGKADLSASTLEVVDPDGKRFDIRDRAIDTGYTPNEGHWTAGFTATKPGLYVVAHTFDKVMSYAPVRAVKSAKTCFVASKSLDKVTLTNPGFDRAFQHPFELIPVANPVTPMGPGTPFKVKLVFKGKPAANTRISFIPRGETLSAGMDARYERTTDDQGLATFTPTAGNVYLIVAHREEKKESGKDYRSTKYSAALVVYVPQICPCCGE